MRNNDDPLDTALAVGGAMDFVTPLISFVQDWYYGPAADFGMHYTGILNRGDVKRILKRHGIRSWGRIYTIEGDTLMFTVNINDAQSAYDAMQNAGATFMYFPRSVTPRNQIEEIPKKGFWDWLFG